MASVSRAVIEVLLDRISQGAGTLSSEGRVTFANQRFASMLGIGRAQIVGKPLAELVADADRDALVTFAPLGHGQASCLVTDVTQGRQVGALAHEIRTSVEILRRNSLDENSQRALDRIVELLEDLRLRQA